jgi:hypothetical protein
MKSNIFKILTGLMLFLNFTLGLVELGVSCYLAWVFWQAGLGWFIGFVIAAGLFGPLAKGLYLLPFGCVVLYLIQAAVAYSFGHFLLINFGIIFLPLLIIRSLLHIVVAFRPEQA